MPTASKTTHQPSSIAIVGAGIMGRVLAWQLHQNGYQVTVFDKDAKETGSAAAYAAAAMLTPYCEIESAELSIFTMGIQSLNLWPPLLKSLNAEHLLNQTGTLVVAHRQDKADFERFLLQLNHKLNHATAHYQQLGKKELNTFEVDINDSFQEACYLPQEACLNNPEIMSTLAKALQQHIQWHSHTPIDNLQPHQVHLSHQIQTFDTVIDCRGLGAKNELPDLRGVRGEIIRVHAPKVNLTHIIRVMHPRYPLYIVPQSQQHFLIGATLIESDDMSPISVRSTLELLSAAYSVHAGFDEAHIVETRVNCRPAMDDNLPYMDYQPGLIRVNGLYRHGFLLAPVLSEQILHYLQKHSQ